RTRREVSRLECSRKSPVKSRSRAVCQSCDFRGGPVAGQDDLFMPVEKRIECVKEFFLGTLLASEKLDIVNQKKIGLAITLPEFDQITVLDRIDELVDEEFARDIEHLHVFLLRPHVLAD